MVLHQGPFLLSELGEVKRLATLNKTQRTQNHPINLNLSHILESPSPIQSVNLFTHFSHFEKVASNTFSIVTHPSQWVFRRPSSMMGTFISNGEHFVECGRPFIVVSTFRGTSRLGVCRYIAQNKATAMRLFGGRDLGQFQQLLKQLKVVPTQKHNP